MKRVEDQFESIGTSFLEFEKFCKEEKLNPNKIEVKQDFFKKYLDGRIVIENGKIIKKKIRTKGC